MHPDQLRSLALDHQAELLAEAARIRAGRPVSSRPRLRQRWRGVIGRMT
jgi:hypothetical protein